MSAREKTESPAKTARRTTAPESAAITFEGLQSRGEKLAEWIGANPAPILGTLAAVLVVAAVIGFVESSRNEASQEAALALATVQTDYRAAMGAQPGDTAVPEPANPETARRVRTDYAERFAKVAVEYAGTPVGAMASLERGALQQELGDAAGAIATWDEAARRATGAIRGILLTRVGEARESAHDPAGAAESYEQAGAIADFPLRHRALADAARCRADAGENDAAIALLQRLESEAPDYAIPAAIGTRLAELRAARQTD